MTKQITIGTILIKYRELHKLNQSDLAKYLGIHRSTINFIENGRRKASLTVLSTINKRLGVGMDKLFRANERIEL